jgi:hypothetical protein
MQNSANKKQLLPKKLKKSSKRPKNLKMLTAPKKKYDKEQ